MRFKDDVRKFMRAMELAFIKDKTIIQEQSRMILVLQEQNRDLMNRLMARDYPELQTYTSPTYKKEGEVDYDFTSDEDFAGTDVDPDAVEDTE